MFTAAKNIDTAFRQVKLLAILSILGSASVALFAVYSARAAVARSAQRIYVLANGKILEAFAADRKDNIPVEARDEVRMFHYYFFTLDPDDQVIRSNMASALYLCDASAKQQYDGLRENSYYANVIAGNISQRILIDSIRVDVDRYPYYFRLFARLRITRPSTIITRSLVTEGYLRNVLRSDHNPHGFLIERWRTLENRDIGVEDR